MTVCLSQHRLSFFLRFLCITIKSARATCTGSSPVSGTIGAGLSGLAPIYFYWGRIWMMAFAEAILELNS